MPDLLAGSLVAAADTPPMLANAQVASYTATITSYGVATASGTYADCGGAFVAPTTGRVVIVWQAGLSNSGSGGTLVSPAVRTGSTVGSGTVVLAATDDNQASHDGSTYARDMAEVVVEGLTAGDSYNVRLEHRVTSGTGTFRRRYVRVTPLP